MTGAASGIRPCVIHGARRTGPRRSGIALRSSMRRAARACPCRGPIRAASAEARVTRQEARPPEAGAAKAEEARPKERAWLPRMETIRVRRATLRLVVTGIGRLEAVAGREPVHAIQEFRLRDVREIEVEIPISEPEPVRDVRDRADRIADVAEAEREQPVELVFDPRVPDVDRKGA